MMKVVLHAAISSKNVQNLFARLPSSFEQPSEALSGSLHNTDRFKAYQEIIPLRLFIILPISNQKLLNFEQFSAGVQSGSHQASSQSAHLVIT